MIMNNVNTTNTYTADVIIVGAGPAGSTAAALLARAGLHVLLADRADFPRDKTCGDGLTPRAVAVLDRLGVLPALQARGYQSISGAVTVAPSGAAFTSRFAEACLGLPQFGMVVPRFELDDLLRQHAVDAGAQFLPGLHVTGPVYQDGGPLVTGVRGQLAGQEVMLAAPLTILATGASIGLLRAFGVLQRIPPGVNAIRGYFTGVEGLTDRFEFYFDRELNPGYGWIFPLADGRANVGVGLFNARRDNAAAETAAANPRRLLAEFMARHPRLATARPDGPIKGYPLRTDFPTCRPSGPGYLLVGETLGLVHPVTGEGIDLAIESAELAAAAALAALRCHNVSPAALRPYDRALMRRYATLFRGARLLLRYATGPRALNILIGKAEHKPYLARAIAGINLGVISPLAALSPHVWWDVLT
jgi:menaquinone-9 beta-reductase